MYHVIPTLAQYTFLEGYVQLIEDKGGEAKTVCRLPG